MAVTVTTYNHTSKLFAEGANASADVYKVKLYSAATFNAADTTLASISGTESSTGTGYVAGGKALSNVTVSTVTTNDAKFDADDLSWTASGGSITASYGVLYNDSDAGDPPIAFIDFDGSKSASDGAEFKLTWDAGGIFIFTVT